MLNSLCHLIGTSTSDRSRMSKTNLNKELSEEIEAALLDTDLFLKYGAHEKAMGRLQSAINTNPRSIILRERLREIASVYKHTVEAARQCLALAGLYLVREDLETAYNRLLEAKQLDPRISITSGLEAIRRARRPEPHNKPQAVETSSKSISSSTLAGDLSTISVFDVVQVIENSKLTGTLHIKSKGRVFFNSGLIVSAETDSGATAREAFSQIIEATNCPFDFELSDQDFPISIDVPNNTSLMLDSLREIDEQTK
jgi:tetratricopeptide (TPR) repeat protein